MPKSKIEAEYVKLGKLDPEDYEKRQDFLKAVMDAGNAFKDPVYNKLSEKAQEWLNVAIKAFKAKKALPDFPDVGAVPKDEEDDKPAKKKKAAAVEEDEDEEEETPKKKKAKAVEEDEEEEADEEEDEPAPKKKAKKAVEEDEEEEDEPAPKKKKKAAADEDEEEDEPAPKKKKAKPVEEDEDEEEDEPAPKKKAKKPAKDEDDDEKPAKKKADKVPAKPSGVKVAIKEAIIADPEISVDAIVKKLEKAGASVSKVTVGNVRADFRHSLRVLKENGHLKGLSI